MSSPTITETVNVLKRNRVQVTEALGIPRPLQQGLLVIAEERSC